jgi:hypothetical protein
VRARPKTGHAQPHGRAVVISAPAAQRLASSLCRAIELRMLQDQELLSPDQLRHAADLLEKARKASSRAEVLALLGSAREICERMACELTSVLTPNGAVLEDVLAGLRRRSSP